MTQERKLAIIGVGPRGHYALENLITKIANTKSYGHIHIYLYETTGNFGNGAIYDLDQLASNWINITERILCLESRPIIHFGEINIPGFPSYHEWADLDFDSISEKDPDVYPPRAKIGSYLKQRFETLSQPLINANIISLIEEAVIDIDYITATQINVRTALNPHHSMDEVLITIGHQPTEVSKQIDEWRDYFSNNKKVDLFEDPYPISSFLESKNLDSDSIIGIRGLGLAMIDIVRAIANKFGTFKIIDAAVQKCSYKSSSELSNLLVPFSLDGLPPAPKPLNAAIDRLYSPTDEQILEFERIIGNSQIQRNANGLDFLIEAFAPIAAAIYNQLPQTIAKDKFSHKDLQQITLDWLREDSTSHSLIISRKQSVQKTMQDFVDMATATGPVSLDYCIGQVWKHCQPIIYEQLSYNACKEEVFAEIIHLDERLKRYSYGPPVESIQQLLALDTASVINFDFVNDPKIELTSKGWQLESEGQVIKANMMINSVLDAPQIKSVDSPLVKNMLSHELIKAVHDDFGVATDDFGYLIPKESKESISIALLGRLAKGTIIGVDAILECFGSRPESWASKAVEKHINWLEQNG